jgi:hypothetical protein
MKDAKEKLLARLRAQHIEVASLDSLGFEKLQKLRTIYQELLKLSGTVGEIEEWTLGLNAVHAAIKGKGSSSNRRRQRIQAADALTEQDRVFQGVSKGLGFSKVRDADAVSSARIVPGGRADGNKRT